MLLTLVSLYHARLYVCVSACLYDRGLSAKPPPPYPGAGDQSSREGTGPCFWLLFLCIICLSVCLSVWGLADKSSTTLPWGWGPVQQGRYRPMLLPLVSLYQLFVCMSICMGTVSQTTTTLPWCWGPVQQGRYKPILLTLVSLYQWFVLLCVRVTWDCRPSHCLPTLVLGTSPVEKIQTHVSYACATVLSVCVCETERESVFVV